MRGAATDGQDQRDNSVLGFVRRALFAARSSSERRAFRSSLDRIACLSDKLIQDAGAASGLMNNEAEVIGHGTSGDPRGGPA